MSDEMVLCTRCGQNQVSAPSSIEEDPVCADCIRDLMEKAADVVMGSPRRRVDKVYDWAKNEYH